ncbi:histidine phosphotransferase family protein [Marivita hallyeonensis]|uniref:Histidine phosphotransferase ChpT n=1 Tax=Marivita hallyeonensis TaxID=996342 RepID=A0A1M5QN84_9RHOB|nr:histidine phosphotransferase family protein [Marivita hallyeonensis]SHH15341.1 histidine phosphotransferase ChpT [Marivita hallyeonensis]
MHHDKASLAALIGSRICHDLISPIGAISNGLELVAMGTPDPASPEMTLIQQSCDNAAARIQFFRIAFGSAGDPRLVSADEARRTLANHYGGTRIITEWALDDPASRDTVQFGFLAALCLESALGQGGSIVVAVERDAVLADARGPSILNDADCWSLLETGAGSADQALRPAQVQFAFLRQLCTDAGVTPLVQVSATHAQVVIPLTTA